MSMRPTPTGWLVLLLCVLFYFAALTSQSSLLLILLGLLAGCGVANAWLGWRLIRGVSVVAPAREVTVEGGRLTQPWRMEARGTAGAGGALEVFLDGERWLGCPDLRPGVPRHVLPDITPKRRGVWAMGGFEVVTASPFGLVRVARRLSGVAGELVVGPSVYATDGPVAAAHDVLVGGRFRGGRRVASGLDFAGVRPMRAEDSWRQVHWKASARGQGMMVKTFDEETSGRIALWMDGGGMGRETQREDAVRAAGSLILAALDEGHHVEWVDLGSGEVTMFPPFVDSGEVLDRLARWKPSVGWEARFDGEVLQGKFSRRGSVAVVMYRQEGVDAVSAWVGGAAGAGRVVAWYLPEAGMEAGGLPGVIWRYGKGEIRVADGPSGR